MSINFFYRKLSNLIARGKFLRRSVVQILMLTLLISGVSPITAASAALSTQSICFDGGQTIQFNTTAIGTVDFTTELWVKPSSNVGYETFLDLGYQNNGAYLGYDGNAGVETIMFYTGGPNSHGVKVPVGKWTHVAMVRLSSQITMYINGIEVGREPYSANLTSTKIYVGSPMDGSIKSYKGCMASVRIVKSAVYSANFTPADVGSFTTVPNATTPLIELTANGGVLQNSGSLVATVQSSTLTYQSLVQSQSALTISSTSSTYGSTLALTTAGGSGSGATSFVVDSGPCTASVSTLTPTAAGTCYVTATKAAQGNYTSASTSSTAITINKATPTFSNFANVSKAYGDSSFNLATPTSSTPGTWTYSTATPSVVSLSGNTATVAGAGTAVITATFAPTDSANFVSGGTIAMTVTVAKASLGITASSHTVAYGGAVPTIAPTYLGFVNGDSSGVVTGTTCSTTYTTTTTVGTTGSSCTGATASNYSFTYTAGVVTVIQSGQTTALTISSTSATYGSTLSLTTTGGSGSGANSFVVDSGPCTVFGSTLTPTAAGTCYVTATKAAQGNYTSASSSSTAITISKATPTFSNFANVGKTYGAPNFNLATPTSSTPGTWTYLSATPSVISIAGNTATVAGYGTSVITATFSPSASTDYYSDQTITMTVTVDKASLGITASSHTVAYGGSVPTITPTYSGFVNGEDASVVSGTTCSTTYTTATAVGINGSTCTGATASNYSFTYTGGVITIIRSGQTTALTISSTSVTYGSNLSLSATGGSGSGANSFVVDSGPCTVTGSTLTPTAAGTCYVTATKAANGNYLLASSLSTAIAIARKGLTISGLSGVNKEFDGGRVGSVTGTPTLVGIANSDDVLLGGTPTFTYASSNVASGITVAASNYTLTGTTAGNYLLTQPTVTANITAKAIRVVANNVTVAFGAPVISSVTAIGVVSPDSVSTASYTFAPPGTSAVPTAVGVYAVEPSNAIFGTGLIANYLITYEAATVTILAKYTVTYNGNGGTVAAASTSNVDFVVGNAALTLPTATREGFSFLGWFTTETGSTQVVGDYTPTATATLWAHWIQKSLVGIGNSQKIGTITTLANVSNTYSATSLNGSVEVTYVANALAASTVIDIYQMTDSSRASSLISSANTYVLSLVIAWLTPTGTVPVLSSSDALTMLIRDGAIKKGAKVYSLVGNSSTLLGIATVDGSVTVKITEDPEVYIAISKSDAPTGVSATSGGNASSMVSWTAPSDGGSAINLFTAISNAGQSCTSATTSCLVTGLTNGTPYTFTVTATNTIGVSDASATSAAATPAAPVANVSSPGAVDDSAASAAAQAKIEADKKAAELKAAAEKKAAEEAAVAAKAAKPAVTLYSVSSTLKLNAHNLAYLQKYVKSLKNGASVTCIGYSYSKKTTLKKANSLAKSQATAVCSLVKKTNKTLKTSIVVYPVTKAPKAATGAKWVGVSYRVDGFGSK